jgi:hypothetical protein
VEGGRWTDSPSVLFADLDKLTTRDTISDFVARNGAE